MIVRDVGVEVGDGDDPQTHQIFGDPQRLGSSLGMRLRFGDDP